MVDPYDESFYNPVKKVGRYMTRAEADAEEAKGNYVTEVPGKAGSVSCPRQSRSALSRSTPSVPSWTLTRSLSPAEAAVSRLWSRAVSCAAPALSLKKDLVSGLLAKEIDADVLMILTDVEQVSLNYGKADEIPLSHMTVEEAEKYAEKASLAPLPCFRRLTQPFPS